MIALEVHKDRQSTLKYVYYRLKNVGLVCFFSSVDQK